jgi:hypothetical protein
MRWSSRSQMSIEWKRVKLSVCTEAIAVSPTDRLLHISLQHCSISHRFTDPAFICCRVAFCSQECGTTT